MATEGEEETFTIKEQVVMSDDDNGEEGGPLSDEDHMPAMEDSKLSGDMDMMDEEEKEPRPVAQVTQRPAVMDDFIRNFLVKNGMMRTLEAFQAEWYDKKPENEDVPNLYVGSQTMMGEINLTQKKLMQSENITDAAKQSWEKFRKERDYHRMNHRRIQQEKEKLLVELKRLKRHYEQYEPTLTELRHKYVVAMKEKMLMRLERDRFVTKADSLEEQLKQMTADKKEDGPTLDAEEDVKPKKENQDSPWPEEKVNPYLNSNFAPMKGSEMKLLKTFRGHAAAISSLAFHPKLPVVATVSDDQTWKMWSLPNGELVMSGEGHKHFVSGISFHSKGNLVSTSSGDSTVKIWDMVKESCVHTFTDHSQAVWSCSFHSTGNFLVSSSMDQTAKVFDLGSMRCRQTLRGHVDCVNSVTFQPYGNTICTASADKTVSLWDLRTGLCVQTFYGHGNAVNHACFNNRGTTIASCDADGMCKLWDVRYVSEFLHIDSGQHPANGASFDRSCRIIAIASGDATVKLFDLEEKAFVVNLEGHEDGVLAAQFDYSGKYLVSSSSDRTFRVWQ